MLLNPHTIAVKQGLCSDGPKLPSRERVHQFAHCSSFLDVGIAVDNESKRLMVPSSRITFPRPTDRLRSATANEQFPAYKSSVGASSMRAIRFRTEIGAT
jgi:hypothetical protein